MKRHKGKEMVVSKAKTVVVFRTKRGRTSRIIYARSSAAPVKPGTNASGLPRSAPRGAYGCKCTRPSHMTTLLQCRPTAPPHQTALVLERPGQAQGHSYCSSTHERTLCSGFSVLALGLYKGPSFLRSACVYFSPCLCRFVLFLYRESGFSAIIPPRTKGDKGLTSASADSPHIFLSFPFYTESAIRLWRG